MLAVFATFFLSCACVCGVRFSLAPAIGYTSPRVQLGALFQSAIFVTLARWLAFCDRRVYPVYPSYWPGPDVPRDFSILFGYRMSVLVFPGELAVFDSEILFPSVTPAFSFPWMLWYPRLVRIACRQCGAATPIDSDPSHIVGECYLLSHWYRSTFVRSARSPLLATRN